MHVIVLGTILLAGVTAASAQTTSTAQSASVVIEANSPVLRRAQITESIGVETLGGVFTPILKAGCSLPCEVTNTFSTAEDNQSEIKISLFRGSGARVSENHSLGSFVILGIPPLPRGKPIIAVTLRAAGADIILIASDSAGARLRIERRGK
jgi:molecular chaperone DnaK